MKSTKYIFLCNALDDGTKNERAIETDSPAATNKVFGLWRGLKTAGGKVCVLSMGRGRQNGSGECYPANVKRILELPVIYALFCNIPVLTHLVTAVSVVLCLNRIVQGDFQVVLVVYNRQWHFVPAVIFARLLRARCYLDLEDGAFVESDRGVRRLRNRLMRAIFDRLCDQGVLLASSGLGDQTGQRRKQVVYGVTEHCDFERKWEAPVKVLFGGSLMEETGVQWFMDAVLYLIEHYPESKHRIHFIVTGKGTMAAELRVFADVIDDGLVEFRGEVGRAEYMDLLQSCHVGLCLKRPSSDMGQMTFPSKVIELAAYGLLLISARVSDVPRVFPEGTAYLLENEQPAMLAARLAWVVTHQTDARTAAQAGQRQIHTLCAIENIGFSLRKFLDTAAVVT